MSLRARVIHNQMPTNLMSPTSHLVEVEMGLVERVDLPVTVRILPRHMLVWNGKRRLLVNSEESSLGELIFLKTIPMPR